MVINKIFIVLDDGGIDAAGENEVIFFLLNFKIFYFNKIKFYRVEHIAMHEKHKGHDAMHMEMVLILVFTLLIAQIALFEWKKRHYKSYSVRKTDETNLIII